MNVADIVKNIIVFKGFRTHDDLLSYHSGRISTKEKAKRTHIIYREDDLPF